MSMSFFGIAPTYKVKVDVPTLFKSDQERFRRMIVIVIFQLIISRAHAMERPAPPQRVAKPRFLPRFRMA